MQTIKPGQDVFPWQYFGGLVGFMVGVYCEFIAKPISSFSQSQPHNHNHKPDLDDSVISELGKFEPNDFKQGSDIELTITQKFEEFEKDRNSKKKSNVESSLDPQISQHQTHDLNSSTSISKEQKTSKTNRIHYDPSTGTGAEFVGFLSGKMVELLCFGVAIGLLKSVTHVIGFLTVMIPASACECIDIGHTLSKMRFVRPTLAKAALVLTAAATPIGLLISSNLTSTTGYIQCAAMAFCAGQFIFICACLLINKEFKEGHKNVQMYLFFSVGILVMVILWAVSESKS